MVQDNGWRFIDEAVRRSLTRPLVQPLLRLRAFIE
jgi:hypothetical protein